MIEAGGRHVTDVICVRSLTRLSSIIITTIIQIKPKCVSVRPSVCMSVCMLLLGERLDGFEQFFLEVVGEVQGSVS